jgi:hypothetical protein
MSHDFQNQQASGSSPNLNSSIISLFLSYAFLISTSNTPKNHNIYTNAHHFTYYHGTTVAKNVSILASNESNSTHDGDFRHHIHKIRNPA